MPYEFLKDRLAFGWALLCEGQFHLIVLTDASQYG